MKRLWLFSCIVLLATGMPAPLTFQGSEVPWHLLALSLAAFWALLWLGLYLGQRRRPANRPILIDGSNVMHWDNGVPDINLVRRIVEALQSNAFSPSVVFDANAGYKLADRYMNEATLASQLGLPVKQVRVAPKGTPADPFLLQAARDMGAPIVTNDRFRDWAGDFPDIVQPQHLIRGGFHNGAPYLKTTT